MRRANSSASDPRADGVAVDEAEEVDGAEEASDAFAFTPPKTANLAAISARFCAIKASPASYKVSMLERYSRGYSDEHILLCVRLHYRLKSIMNKRL